MNSEKMKLYWIFVVMPLQQLTTLVLSDSYYAITAPGLMKSNRKYTVAVTVDNVEETCLLRIIIMGISFNASQEVQLGANEVKLIDFYPPKLLEGDYKLLAEGIQGIRFKNETELLIDSEAGPKIYIQTDKGVYKPQDLVQFRVVMLDEHTRPLKIREPIRVDIMDPDNNRVKQFKDITLIKGVFTEKFKLSQRPVMGTWTIKVKISGKYNFYSSKNIKVKKYTLPKFQVDIHTAKFLTLRDDIKTIKTIIFGKYNFGNYVEGNATVKLFDGYNKVLLQEKMLDVKAPTAVEFQLESVKDLYSLNIVASITDKYSGTTQSNHVNINVYQNRYFVEAPWEEMQFLDGKPYILRVHVEHWTGAPVLDNTTPVILKQGEMEQKEFLDDKGVATFKIDYNDDSEYKIIFNDSEIMPNLFVRSVKNELSFCKLKLIGESPRLGNQIEIEVTSTEVIPYLVYVLMGHGSVIAVEYVTLKPQQKSYIIRITPSIEMVPVAYLYVYFIHNGNYRYEEMKIMFPEEFENQISVTAPKQLRPGQEVSLIINAQPNSYISILAVDMSVYLMDRSYDLDRNEILQHLLTDKSYVKYRDDDYTRPGILSGLITLSNAYHLLIGDFTDVDPNHEDGGDFVFRKNFPETWIFQNLEVNSSNTQLTLNLPDTITTWRITAFSNNDITGFGIVDKSTDITAKQPFFISLNLPYSVKLGEVIVLSASIFNYLQKSVYTESILFNNENEFQFMDKSIDPDQKKLTKHVNISINSAEVVKFLIKPLKIGEISLYLTASNDLYTDAVLHKLKVEAGGVTKTENKAVYINVFDNETLASNFSIRFPRDFLSNSEYITLRVGGDYLMPAVENLDKLIDMPTGCGEQNMINLAPSVLILELLKATGKYSRERDLVARAKSYTEIGYQQQLAYRHRSGGYSVFGEKSDEEESTWLTAYVVRFFIKASKYTKIESRIIESGLEYLSKQQLDDGSFPYTGYLFMPAQENIFGMTAYVLLTFMESKKYSNKYQTKIEKATQFLNSNVDNIDDLYALSIIATALKVVNSPKANNVLNRLRHLSKDNERGHKWWSANDKSSEKDVEITAYISMALLDTPGEHTPVLKWLIAQRNDLGGFQSTHDTVVGLQALVKFSGSLQNVDNVAVDFKYAANDENRKEVDKGEFTVNGDNITDLITHELPRSTRFVEFSMNGTGYALVQLSYQYNILNESQTDNSNKASKKEEPHHTHLVNQSRAIVFSESQPDSPNTLIVPRIHETKKKEERHPTHLVNQSRAIVFSESQPDSPNTLIVPRIHETKKEEERHPTHVVNQSNALEFSESQQESPNMLIVSKTLETDKIEEHHHTHFVIQPKAIVLSSILLELEICFTYHPLLDQTTKSTNMVIMEANLPTGYQSDADSNIDLLENDLIERIESLNDDTKIILYFDSLVANSNQCIKIDGEKTYDVVEFKPVAIQMYDYYNRSRSDVKFYNIES